MATLKKDFDISTLLLIACVLPLLLPLLPALHDRILKEGLVIEVEARWPSMYLPKYGEEIGIGTPNYLK